MTCKSAGNLQHYHGFSGTDRVFLSAAGLLTRAACGTACARESASECLPGCCEWRNRGGSVDDDDDDNYTGHCNWKINGLLHRSNGHGDTSSVICNVTAPTAMPTTGPPTPVRLQQC